MTPPRTIRTDLRDHYVYRAFDKNGDLLYIGCSNQPRKRWAAHTAERPHMTCRAARFKLQGPYSYSVARDIEREALRTEEPEFGWTPAKRREKRLRDEWIQDRIIHFAVEPNLSYSDCVRRALDEADEWFPHPLEFDRPSSPQLRVVAS